MTSVARVYWPHVHQPFWAALAIAWALYVVLVQPLRPVSGMLGTADRSTLASSDLTKVESSGGGTSSVGHCEGTIVAAGSCTISRAHERGRTAGAPEKAMAPGVGVANASWTSGSVLTANCQLAFANSY